MSFQVDERNVIKILPLSCNPLEIELMDKFLSPYLNHALAITYDTRKYYITQYRFSMDFHTYIKRYPLREDNLVEYTDVLVSVAKALQCLHSRNIIHGDVKPANIFIDADTNHSVLGDFGHAHYIDRKKYHVIGTCGHQAPEILEKKNWNEKSDIWSFGCLVHMCIYRQNLIPNQGNSTGALAATLDLLGFDVSHLQTNFYFNFIDPHLRESSPHFAPFFAVIDGCLKYNPEDRLSASGILDILSNNNPLYEQEFLSGEL